MANIDLRDIEKYFGENYVVRKLNLQIYDSNSRFCWFSGCGKTTTLRAIAGLQEIDSGDILIDGKAVQSPCAPADRDIAFVFQFFALYPHLSQPTITLRSRCVRAARVAADRRAGTRGGEASASSSS